MHRCKRCTQLFCFIGKEVGNNLETCMGKFIAAMDFDIEGACMRQRLRAHSILPLTSFRIGLSPTHHVPVRSRTACTPTLQSVECYEKRGRDECTTGKTIIKQK